MKPMKQRKPDVLDALMSADMDDDLPEEDEGADMAVMSFEDEDDVPEAPGEEGTPEATIADIRRGLDELEAMFAGG